MGEQQDKRGREEEQVRSSAQGESGPDELLTEEEGTAAGPEKEGASTALYYWLQAVTVVLTVLILVGTFVGRLTVVVGQSMDPTLQNGELLILQSLGYTPQQGDIVVVNKLDAPVLEGEAIVKRCIAVGGQTVKIDYEAGTVSVDGVVLDEPYILERMQDPSLRNSNMSITEVTVPEGCIFVMGDNRNNSTDSRHVQVGVIDERYVLGGARFAIFPLSKLGPV